MRWKNPKVPVVSRLWQWEGYPKTVLLTGLEAGNMLPRECGEGKGQVISEKRLLCCF